MSMVCKVTPVVLPEGSDKVYHLYVNNGATATYPLRRLQPATYSCSGWGLMVQLPDRLAPIGWFPEGVGEPRPGMVFISAGNRYEVISDEEDKQEDGNNE